MTSEKNSGKYLPICSDRTTRVRNLLEMLAIGDKRGERKSASYLLPRSFTFRGQSRAKVEYGIPKCCSSDMLEAEFLIGDLGK